MGRRYQKDYARRYYQDHRGKINDYARRYYYTHRDQILSRKSEARRVDPEITRILDAKYYRSSRKLRRARYLRQREKRCDQTREWRKKNWRYILASRRLGCTVKQARHRMRVLWFWEEKL